MKTSEFKSLIEKIFKDCMVTIDSENSTINLWGGCEVSFYTYSSSIEDDSYNKWFFDYRLDGKDHKYYLGDDNLEAKLHMIYELIYLPLVEVEKKVKEAFSTIRKINENTLRDFKLKVVIND
jgi:hypothetical protein